MLDAGAMDALDACLRLRPGNVVARLPEGSRLPLLNPVDLLRALGEQPRPLLCAPVIDFAALPGLLRAARLNDAVLGLSWPSNPADREGPARLFSALSLACQADEHPLPILLQGGPIRVSPSDGQAVATTEGAVFRFVDAGFTLISLDLSRLPRDRALELYVNAVRPALEAELPVELIVGVDMEGGPGGLEHFLSVIGAQVAPPRVLRFVWTTQAGQTPGQLLGLAHVCARFNVALAVEDYDGADAKTVASWRIAGVRKLDASHAMARACLKVLTPEEREAVRARGASAMLPMSELVSLWLSGREPLSPGQLEALEAQSFLELEEQLRRVGAPGSGREALRYLSAGAAVER